MSNPESQSLPISLSPVDVVRSLMDKPHVQIVSANGEPLVVAVTGTDGEIKRLELDGLLTPEVSLPMTGTGNA